jgi:hypothetical protein
MSHYKKAGKEHSVTIANRSFEDVEKFQVFGNSTNKLNSHARRDSEQTEFGECLLSFGSLLFSASCVRI